MTPFSTQQRSTKLKARAEKFCAKLNDGLAAVAFVLAVAVFISGTYRTVELLAATAQDRPPGLTDLSGFGQAPQ
jgi:hypothetical protein